MDIVSKPMACFLDGQIIMCFIEKISGFLHSAKVKHQGIRQPKTPDSKLDALSPSYNFTLTNTGQWEVNVTRS